MTTKYSQEYLLKISFISVFSILLAACVAPSFKADVSRFQSELPGPEGESFAVITDDPDLVGGIEFGIYAGLVENHLSDLGYAKSSAENASLLVRFTYGVDNGRDKIRSIETGFHDPFWGSWYGPYPSRFHRPRLGASWSFGFHDPWLNDPKVRSYTVYTSEVDLKIDRSLTNERVFEGNAKAVSSSNNLQHVVPKLVEAMFTDFPGNSGETIRITVRPEDTAIGNVVN
jgi:hypothetical protein